MKLNELIDPLKLFLNNGVTLHNFLNAPRHVGRGTDEKIIKKIYKQIETKTLKYSLHIYMTSTANEGKYNLA